jgi:hypothetical protein
MNGITKTLCSLGTAAMLAYAGTTAELPTDATALSGSIASSVSSKPNLMNETVEAAPPRGDDEKEIHEEPDDPEWEAREKRTEENAKAIEKMKAELQDAENDVATDTDVGMDAGVPSDAATSGGDMSYTPGSDTGTSGVGPRDMQAEMDMFGGVDTDAGYGSGQGYGSSESSSTNEADGGTDLADTSSDTSTGGTGSDVTQDAGVPSDAGTDIDVG